MDALSNISNLFTYEETAELLRGAGVSDERITQLLEPSGQNPALVNMAENSTAPSFEDRVLRMMNGISQRLDKLEGNAKATTVAEALPGHTSPTAMSALWCDRPTDNSELDPGYKAYVYNGYWDDTESNLATVSETTASHLKTVYSVPIPYPVPRVDHTKCPKLDRVLMSNISKETKDKDNQLAKIQTLFLDAVAPLSHLMELAESKQLSPEVTIEAVKTALALMGNASSHLSKEGRNIVVKDLNKDAASLAEEDEMFKEAAPQLFGEGFETKLKQHLDAVRCLRKAPKTWTAVFLRRPPPGQLQPWGQHSQGTLQQRSSSTTVSTVPEREQIQVQAERTVMDKGQTEPPQQVAQLNKVEVEPFVLVYKDIPLLYQMICCQPCVTVNQLLKTGVRELAIELAQRNLPLAGRLKHAFHNWQVITKDAWVLEAVSGYRIPLQAKPYQASPPNQSVLNTEDQKLMKAEIESMLDKMQ